MRGKSSANRKESTVQEKYEHQILFNVTESEYHQIRAKMEQMEIHNMSAYLRKMAIDGYCIHLDLNEIRKMTTLIKRCSNNLNQYARKANQTGSIYKRDIEDIQNLLEKIYQSEERILEDLQYLRK